jgi:hypothetical protein
VRLLGAFFGLDLPGSGAFWPKRGNFDLLWVCSEARGLSAGQGVLFWACFWVVGFGRGGDATRDEGCAMAASGGGACFGATGFAMGGARVDLGVDSGTGGGRLWGVGAGIVGAAAAGLPTSSRRAMSCALLYLE